MGPVLDPSGRRVASFAIDDQRLDLDEPIFAVFEERDPAWEKRLPSAGAQSDLRVSLVWPSGDRLDGVRIVEVGTQGPTLDATWFRLEHDDL